MNVAKCVDIYVSYLLFGQLDITVCGIDSKTH